jgi:hypothetical protein
MRQICTWATTAARQMCCTVALKCLLEPGSRSVEHRWRCTGLSLLLCKGAGKRSNRRPKQTLELPRLTRRATTGSSGRLAYLKLADRGMRLPIPSSGYLAGDLGTIAAPLAAKGTCRRPVLSQHFLMRVLPRCLACALPVSGCPRCAGLTFLQEDTTSRASQ